MLDFLRPESIFTVLKFCLAFLVLVLVPVGGLVFIKRRRCLPEHIFLLNRCIMQGHNLTQAECKRTHHLIRQLKASLDYFRTGNWLGLDRPFSLVEVLQTLPLLYEISLPGTCCELPQKDGLFVPRLVECKSTVKELLRELKEDPQMPVLAEEMELVEEASRELAAKRPLRRRRLLLWLMIFSLAALQLARVLVLEGKGWKLGLGLYVVSFALFSTGYDYYYSEVFARYRRKLERRLKK